MIKQVIYIVVAVAFLLTTPIDARIGKSLRDGLLFLRRLLQGSVEPESGMEYEYEHDRQPGDNGTEYEYEYEPGTNGTEYEYEYESSNAGIMIGADGSNPPGAVTWMLQSYNPLQVQQGDKVVFAASELHGLTMPDVNGFEQCILPASNLVDPTFGFTFVFDTSTVSPGQSVYFFCPVPGHCELGMKLNLTVI